MLALLEKLEKRQKVAKKHQKMSNSSTTEKDVTARQRIR